MTTSLSKIDMELRSGSQFAPCGGYAPFERNPRQSGGVPGSFLGYSKAHDRDAAHRLTHLDLFSGIGGFALAAKEAGFETIGFSEVDAYASKVLKRHWPDVPNYGDIRTANFGSVGPVTVLTGGFPCQPWSLAGKQRGKEDDRHLWPAMLAAIKAVRPAWVIGENVPGIVGMALCELLSDLEGLGFLAQPFIIPACAVGAPHIRDRVWIVANAEGERMGQGGAACSGDEATLAVPARSGGSALSEEWSDEWTEVSARVCRMGHGLPNRLHRGKGLGNAIVWRVALPFFDAIAAIESARAVAGARLCARADQQEHNGAQEHNAAHELPRPESERGTN